MESLKISSSSRTKSAFEIFKAFYKNNNQNLQQNL